MLPLIINEIMKSLNGFMIFSYSKNIIEPGRKVCLFLPIRYLEGKARRKLFDRYPPKIIYVSTGKLGCAKNGDFSGYYPRAVAFAWFVWVKGHKGRTTLTWFN